jgi:hypothetical protein
VLRYQVVAGSLSGCVPIADAIPVEAPWYSARFVGVFSGQKPGELRLTLPSGPVVSRHVYIELRCYDPATIDIDTLSIR